MLEKVPTPLAGATCNEKIGWLPLGFEDECREIIWSAITDLVKSLRQKKNLKEDIEEVRKIFNIVDEIALKLFFLGGRVFG